MMYSLAVLAMATLTSPSLCSVGELRRSPGYQWTVERIREVVDSAQLIVRAKAVARDRASVRNRELGPVSRIRFEILDVYRGDRPQQLGLRGDTASTDDYNELPVPYRLVRRAGQRGDCFASEYKLGAEYLLLLRHDRGELTTRWWPLAPLNEQVRGSDDPWVLWVRRQMGKD